MGAILHDESSDIAEMVFDHAINEKLNIIFDGTMKNAEKYFLFIQKARKNQYIVDISITDISLEEAMRRAENRYKIEQRRVPKEVIIESHSLVPSVFIKIKDLVDSFFLYDNTDVHPKPFYVKVNGEVLILDEKRLNQFYEKSGRPKEEMSSWIYLKEPQKLSDIIQLAKGSLFVNDRTLQLLDREVDILRFVAENDIETFHYFFKNSAKIHSLTLFKNPELLNEISREMNDQVIQEEMEI
jgi:predicted ABC-type ATPase